jgi:hypothetical protein
MLIVEQTDSFMGPWPGMAATQPGLDFERQSMPSFDERKSTALEVLDWAGWYPSWTYNTRVINLWLLLGSQDPQSFDKIEVSRRVGPWTVLKCKSHSIPLTFEYPTTCLLTAITNRSDFINVNIVISTHRSLQLAQL